MAPEQLEAHEIMFKPKFLEPAMLRKALTGAAAVGIPAGLTAAALSLRFHKKDRKKA